jgi:purine-nucleoside phosphorylase
MQQTIDFINSKTGNLVPETGIILGSGLGDFVNNFNDVESISIPYSEIPGFQTPEVQGHAGQLVLVKDAKCKVQTAKCDTVSCHCEKSCLQNDTAIQKENLSPIHLFTYSPEESLSPPTTHSSLVIMQGRYHFYEGYPMEKIVYPIKVMKKLGVKNLILTNAAGGVNKKFKPSDLMLITDHINFMGTNPLIGKNDETLGTRFPDMSQVYDENLIKIAENAAKEIGIKVKKGVYAAVTGPSYETPREVKMFKKFGADALGMSTAPEAIIANYCGIKVLGISCISNYAAGVQKTPLSHEEVIETTTRATKTFQALLLKILEKI